jgi:hypothetical protein
VIAKLGRVAKALAAAVFAGAASFQAAVDGGVTTWEWATVAAAFIVAFGGVWAIPNKPAEQ